MKIKSSWFSCLLRNFILNLNAYSHDFVITWLLHSHYSYLLMIVVFYELYTCFIDFECRWSCDLHVFHEKYSCFIPYLNDFVLVFKIIIKLVAYFFILEEFSNLSKLFLKLIFEYPFHRRTDGWATTPCEPNWKSF